MRLSSSASASTGNINFLEKLELLQPQNPFHAKSLLVAHQHGQVDASFVLHFLLSEFLRLPDNGNSSDRKVLLILNHQPAHHWFSIATKLGMDLNAFKQRCQLMVMDTLEITFETLTDSNHSEVPTLLDPSTDFLSLDLIQSQIEAKIAELYNGILPTSTKTPKLLIIIENLTSLVNWSQSSDSKIVEFLRYLRFQRQDLEISVASLVFNSEKDTEGKYIQNVISQVLATTTFHVNPLRTGFSSEVHGILTIKNNNNVIHAPSHHRRPKRSRSYQYKLLDRGIHLLPL